ncbi:MAG: maleylpyruvate isomerase N-terminal domain-containing protein [Acidimicrobiia bacterium]|nr:maleylpyruvate isomerase N-terminal domain-containing protein [Acidimicrobiia bacterium]
MDLVFDDLTDAYLGQAEVVRRLVESVDDFSVPTRIEGWSVGVLVGHLSTAIEALWRWSGEAVGDGVELDAVSYWTPVAAFADGSSDWAISYAAGRSDSVLGADLTAALDEGAKFLGAASPGTIVTLPMGGARLLFDQFLATRVLEMTVHGLDLAAALVADGSPAPCAASVTASLLDMRLDGPRPSDLTDDVAWIEAGTGRSTHDDARLPVLV